MGESRKLILIYLIFFGILFIIKYFFGFEIAVISGISYILGDIRSLEIRNNENQKRGVICASYNAG